MLLHGFLSAIIGKTKHRPVKLKYTQSICKLLCILIIPEIAHAAKFEYKAVFGAACVDIMTLSTPVPELTAFTVCTYIKLSSSDPWTAFTYQLPTSSTINVYEFGVLGDSSSLKIWLLGTQINLFEKLNLHTWYEICIMWDGKDESMEFYLDGTLKVDRKLENKTNLAGGGSVVLGCSHFKEINSSVSVGLVGEMYMFRMWNTAQTSFFHTCNDGDVIKWDKLDWIYSSNVVQQDSTLHCAKDQSGAPTSDSSSVSPLISPTNSPTTALFGNSTSEAQMDNTGSNTLTSGTNTFSALETTNTTNVTEFSIGTSRSNTLWTSSVNTNGNDTFSNSSTFSTTSITTSINNGSSSWSSSSVTSQHTYLTSEFSQTTNGSMNCSSNDTNAFQNWHLDICNTTCDYGSAYEIVLKNNCTQSEITLKGLLQAYKYNNVITKTCRNLIVANNNTIIDICDIPNKNPLFVKQYVQELNKIDYYCCCQEGCSFSNCIITTPACSTGGTGESVTAEFQSTTFDNSDFTGDTTVFNGSGTTVYSASSTTLTKGTSTTFNSGPITTLNIVSNTTIDAGLSTTIDSKPNGTIKSEVTLTVNSKSTTLNSENTSIKSSGSNATDNHGTTTTINSDSDTTGEQGTMTTAHREFNGTVTNESHTTVNSGTMTTIDSGTNTTVNSGTMMTIDSGTNTTVNRGTMTTFDSGTNTTVNRGTMTTIDSGTNTTVNRGTMTTIDSGTNTTVNRGTMMTMDSGTNTTVNRGTMMTMDSGTNTTVNRGTMTTIKGGLNTTAIGGPTRTTNSGSNGTANSGPTRTSTHNTTVNTGFTSTFHTGSETINSDNTTKSPSSTDALKNLTDILRSDQLNSSTVNRIVSQLESLLSGEVNPDDAATLLDVLNLFLNVSQSLLGPVSNRLIKIVDKIGLQLTFPGKSITLTSQSLALAVNKVNDSSFTETSFGVDTSSGLQVSLGSQAPPNSDGSILLPASLIHDLSPGDKKNASRVQFNYYAKASFFQDSSLATNQLLVSKVISSSVANLSVTNLSQNITVTLKTSPKNDSDVVNCVFWDFNKNNGSGGWSSYGCFVANTTQSETVCKCNHLTSFAILMDVSPNDPINPKDLLVLTFITYIGCGLSAIFLSVTLVTYIAFEKIRRDYPSKILIQLCAALVCLNLTFLLNPWIALYNDIPGLCISVAAFLHYFLLVSITWMGLEAFHMYLSLVKVFNTYIRKYILKFCIIGWGAPAVVVAIILAVKKDLYSLQISGTYPNGSVDYFCWVDDIVFWTTIVGYYGIIFLLNVSMFVVVLIQLCRIKKQKQLGYQRKTTLQDLRSVAGITFLLGITWGLGFFSFGPGRIAIMYLFTIFNSLQGFFIFFFYCVAKENVRKQWRRYLCCGKFRLAENSDWSKTATNKLKKQTSKQGLSSSSSNSIQSTSNTNSTTLLVSNEYSLHPNGNGKVFKERNGVSFMLQNGEMPLQEFPERPSYRNGDIQEHSMRRTSNKGSVHFIDQI
ncbi:adhesion G-protein coupled receptor G2 isoform X2 [Rhinoderma darwinii]|uniref:adhesion G-protein coupled receptor G2 isoform X2 n=1 Tax=Rhinoderma darwinii TaxID=43563 RepID=UPI003F663633